MSIQLKQHNMMVQVPWTEGFRQKETVRNVKLHYSLTGETQPSSSKLNVDFTSFGDDAGSYRYDWIVGLTIPEGKENWWNWMEKGLREDRAVAVQMIIDCGQSGYTYSEKAALLLGLQPSKETPAWWEKGIIKVIGTGLHYGAGAVQPASRLAATGLEFLSTVPNLLPSTTGKNKDWFIYRFLDAKKECCAIEWNINQSVLLHYGPVLRGSLILGFHGPGSAANKPITVILRPRLGFNGGDGPKERTLLDHLPKVEELEKLEESKQELVRLSIFPDSGGSPKKP